ncbi:DNA recombinase, partial [Bacillus cereus]
MRKFFYIRVSSKDQSIERQLATAAEISIPEEYIFIGLITGEVGS